METNNPYQGPGAQVLVEQSGPVGPAQRRPMGHGGMWWAQGWGILRQNKGMWMLASLVLMLIFIAISLVTMLIPFIGTFIPTLFTPVFVIGLYFIAHRVREQNLFSFGDLFVGFSRDTGQLFLAGLAQIVVMLVFLIVVFVLGLLFFGSSLMMAFGGFADPAAASMMMPFKMFGFALLMVALVIPYVAALWFQIPLVFFGKRNPFGALIESFSAVFRNFLPMLWYGIIGILVFLVLGVVFGVIGGLIAGFMGNSGAGIALLFLLGVIGFVVMLLIMALYATTVYCSFRDIFELSDQAPEQPAYA